MRVHAKEGKSKRLTQIKYEQYKTRILSPVGGGKAKFWISRASKAADDLQVTGLEDSTSLTSRISPSVSFTQLTVGVSTSQEHSPGLSSKGGLSSSQPLQPTEEQAESGASSVQLVHGLVT